MQTRARHFIALAAVFSAGFWLLDAYVDSAVLGVDSFHDSLFHNTGEILFRAFVAVGFIIFGLAAYRMFIRQEQSEQKHLAAVRKTYEESRKFEVVLESLGVGVAIMDLDRRVIYENRVLRDLMGENLEDNCYHAYRGRDSACQSCPMDFPPGDKGPHSMEMEMPIGTGTRYLEILTTPLMDENDSVWGCIKMFKDITLRKETELALKDVLSEIEQRVEDRTVEIHQKNAELQLETQERARAEEQIRASLIEKEVLLKEIHHRVKNNMQIISSFISLQESSDSSGEIGRVFFELKNRIRTMLLIHEKLYQSTDLSNVNARDFIESLVGKLQGLMCDRGEVSVIIDVDEVEMGMDLLIPCGLITNELVSNAFKYAFPEGRGGELTVSLKARGAQRTLTVSDNGVGLPGDMDMAGTGSLGFKIIRALVSQLEGSLDYASNGGASFTIDFIDRSLKPNCWEFMKCGREQGGRRSAELGVCPASLDRRLDRTHHGTNAGRACWVLAGTLCRGTVQGTFADKEHDCMKCEFYKSVLQDESDNLLMSVELLRMLKEE